MRNPTESAQDIAIGVTPSVPWRIIEVKILPHFRLSVTFVDGTAGEVDLSGLIAGERAGIFAALRDPAAFAQGRIECGAVTWPGDIDLAPDAMYDEIRSRGRWVIT